MEKWRLFFFRFDNYAKVVSIWQNKKIEKKQKTKTKQNKTKNKKTKETIEQVRWNIFVEVKFNIGSKQNFKDSKIFAKTSSHFKTLFKFEGVVPILLNLRKILFATHNWQF